MAGVALAAALAVLALAYPLHPNELGKQKATMALADLRGEIHQLSAAIKRGRLADPNSVYFVLSTEVDSVSLYQAVDNLFRTKYRRFAISLVTGIEHLRTEGDKALQSGVARPPASSYRLYPQPPRSRNAASIITTALAVSIDVRHGTPCSAAARRMRKPSLSWLRPRVGVFMISWISPLRNCSKRFGDPS